MLSRWRTAAAVSAISAALLACSDSTGLVPQDLTDLSLDFCEGEAPTFFAIQNDGGPWTLVQPDAAGTFGFQATDKVKIAMTFESSGQVLTDTYYTTAAELAPQSGIACAEAFGTRNLSGSVAPLGASEEVEVSMSGDFAAIFAPSTTYQLTGIADGPQDLLAIRNSFSTGFLIPERVIVQRALNPINNGVLAVLDFGGSEAQPLDTRALTITGLDAGESNFLNLAFRTGLGTIADIYSTSQFTTSPQTIYGIPSAVTQPGDRHILSIEADDASGTAYRIVEHYYRNPSDMTLALRAAVNAPVITSVGSSSSPRYRATITAQSDYGSFATVAFGQQGISTDRLFFVTVTAAYLGGTPLEWVLEMPDLGGVSGFPASAALQSGMTTSWFGEVYSGSLSDYLFALPTDDATVYIAGTFSSFSSVLADRSGDGTAVRMKRTPFRFGERGR